MGKIKQHYMETTSDEKQMHDAEVDIMMEMAGAASFMTNFTRFHKDNPMIFHRVVEFADRQRLKRTHYSIEIILNVIRYHTDLDGKGDPFKINNNYKPFYSRMYMEYRKCPGFFETRTPNLADDVDYSYQIKQYKEWLNEQETNK